MKPSRKVCLFAVVLQIIFGVEGAGAASFYPPAAKDGMVATAQHLASDAGVEVLKNGGNAVDAAVAIAYTLAVVYPAAGNLGGGGFMTIEMADGRKTFLDFREKAPLQASKNMYVDDKGNVVAGLSTKGHLAVAVPGTVAGLEMAREKYGTKPRADLIKRAITLAENGFTLEQGDADLFATAAKDLRQDPASAKIFLKDGEPYKAGDLFVQKDLAHSLRLISDGGADAFYKGPIATAIAEASQKGGGILTPADFLEYQVRERQPVTCNYRGYDVVSAPLPSSGGIVICEILNILEGYPLKDMGFRSAKAVHVTIEAMRHAYADRNTYLGDPDFVQNPTARLIDKNYAAKIRAAIDPHKAGNSQEIRAGVTPHEGTNTTHYSIIDKDGNAVAVTYTLNDWFGARVTADGTGILLNDEMDDFTAKPGTPNLYGLVQGEANSIAPGKRPLSSMSPTIISKDGKIVMVIGTPGGSRIPTMTLHTILNVIDYGMTIQEAIDAPRFHQQWLPQATSVERFALSPDTRAILESMGHTFTDSAQSGHLEGILVGGPSLEAKPKGDMRYFGANDPRRSTGVAEGY